MLLAIFYSMVEPPLIQHEMIFVIPLTSWKIALRGRTKSKVYKSWYLLLTVITITFSTPQYSDSTKQTHQYWYLAPASVTKLTFISNATAILASSFSSCLQLYLEFLTVTISIAVPGLEVEGMMITLPHLACNLGCRCRRHYSCPAKEPDQFHE